MWPIKIDFDPHKEYLLRFMELIENLPLIMPYFLSFEFKFIHQISALFYLFPINLFVIDKDITILYRTH